MTECTAHHYTYCTHCNDHCSQGLGNVVWSLSNLRHHHQGLMDAIASRLTSSPATLQSCAVQDCSNLAVGYARLEVGFRADLIGVLGEWQARYRQQEYMLQQAQALANMAWAHAVAAVQSPWLLRLLTKVRVLSLSTHPVDQLCLLGVVGVGVLFTRGTVYKGVSPSCVGVVGVPYCIYPIRYIRGCHQAVLV